MYNYYPDELIEEIRINNDIVEVISDYVRLERKGKDYFGLCPFHKEKTPSFSVVPGKQIFYCFGCGKGGNVFHFIMNAENLEYIEAVKYLADRAKIQLPEGNEEDTNKARIRRELININTEAARFFHQNLISGKYTKAMEYLVKRGITDRTIKKFGLGFQPEEIDILYRYLKSKGYGDEPIQASGLVLPGKKGGFYDRFRGRIIFPIFDIRGNVIAFGGRVTDSSLPKYMNSPETPVYSKSKNLYSLNFAKNSGEKQIIIVEGYMDVISLQQNGIINTVASLGTALTESQGRLLKKYAEEVIISYDSDSAGQAATLRGLDILNDLGCSVRVLTVPDGKDPDEFIKKNGAEEFRKIAAKSVSLIEYKIADLKKHVDLETTQGRLSFLNKSADLLAKIDNRVELEMYSKKIADDYNISEEAILSEIYKRINKKAGNRNNQAMFREIRKDEPEQDVRKYQSIIHNERMLIAMLCIDNNIYKSVRDKIGTDFIDKENERIFKIITERIDNKSGIVPAELLNVIEGPAANVFASIIQKECNFEDTYKAVTDIIKKIENEKNDIRKQEILSLLNSKEGLSEGDVEKLKKELNSIILAKQKS
ncbi:MAG: DNA primase [Bacillota bacterium]|nr:DNA primase [Bacillota bacterium]